MCITPIGKSSGWRCLAVRTIERSLTESTCCQTQLVILANHAVNGAADDASLEITVLWRRPRYRRRYPLQCFVMAFLYALMIAVVLTAAPIGIPNAIGGVLQRRRFATFALLSCPKCNKAFGRPAIDAGMDTSPWEELWSDGENHAGSHCRPICRIVTCPNCSADSGNPVANIRAIFSAHASPSVTPKLHRDQFGDCPRRITIKCTRVADRAFPKSKSLGGNRAI